MLSRLLRAALIACVLAVPTTGVASAHPDNDRTLTFSLYCPDATWTAKFNGGPSAFHLDGGQLFVWKQIAFITPGGESGVVDHGLRGFAGAPTFDCTYTGAVSGNAYTVTGFYAPAG